MTVPVLLASGSTGIRTLIIRLQTGGSPIELSTRTVDRSSFYAFRTGATTSPGEFRMPACEPSRMQGGPVCVEGFEPPSFERGLQPRAASRIGLTHMKQRQVFAQKFTGHEVMPDVAELSTRIRTCDRLFTKELLCR
jgi:hypothetical protein